MSRPTATAPASSSLLEPPNPEPQKGWYRKGLGALLAMWLSASILPAMPAQAAFPGDNGQVAFTKQSAATADNKEIYTIDHDDTDGSSLENRTNSARHDDDPAFSPDGRRIAFVSERDGDAEIYVMRADGTGTPTKLTDNEDSDLQPAFSPDGRKIAFQRGGDIYVMNASEGTRQTNLTPNTSESPTNYQDSTPAFSPDGTKIAFASSRHPGGIYLMKANGSEVTSVTKTLSGSPSGPSFSPDGSKLAMSIHLSGQFTRLGAANRDIITIGLDVQNLSQASPQYTRVTTHEATDQSPAFSPDGTKIAFVSTRGVFAPGCCGFDYDIFVVPAQASQDANAVNLTSFPAEADLLPDWGPAPGSAPDGDRDGVFNAADNCPTIANPDQADADGDAEGGDACDPDDDNDTVLDAADNCPASANGDQADADGDGLGDVCDRDPSGTGGAGSGGPDDGSLGKLSLSGSDRTAPNLLSFSLKPSRFAAAAGGASVVAAKAKRRPGTLVSYRLSESAGVTFTVETAVAGRRRGGRCVARTRSDRTGKRCTRWVALRGTFDGPGQAGPNSFRFSGRLANRALSSGYYRLVAVARDAAGNASAPAYGPFRILRAGRAK